MLVGMHKSSAVQSMNSRGEPMSSSQSRCVPNTQSNETEKMALWSWMQACLQGWCRVPALRIIILKAQEILALMF